MAAESTKLLYGLSCSRDADTLSKYALLREKQKNGIFNMYYFAKIGRLLEMSLDPTSGIRRSDASSVFRNVASNSYGRDIVFNFLVNRWAEMVAL